MKPKPAPPANRQPAKDKDDLVMLLECNEASGILLCDVGTASWFHPLSQVTEVGFDRVPARSAITARQ